MRVTQIWRYPVKSLQGEPLNLASVTADGIVGDRSFALVDAATGTGLTARREPRLLLASARRRPDGTVTMLLPDGSAADEAMVGAWLGRPVTLQAARPQLRVRFEGVTEEETEPRWTHFDSGSGAFHDADWARVSLLSGASVAGWEPRRFRANLLLSGAGEDGLVGRSVRVGTALLEVVAGIPRCVMVTRPQPGGIERDLTVLRSIHRDRGGRLAVGGRVLESGTVRVGDEVLPL